VTLGEEGVERAEEYERAQKRLQARFGAIKDDIAMMLIPTIERLMDAFAKLLEFVRGNQDVMIGAISAIGGAIVFAGHAAVAAWAPLIGVFLVFEGLVAAAAVFIKTVMDVISGKGTLLQKVLLGIGTALLVVGGILLFFLMPLTSTIAKLLVLFAPITLAIAAIAAAVYLIWKYWDKIYGILAPIGEWFADAGNWVREEFGKAIEWLSNKIEWLIDKLKSAKKWIGAIVDAIPGVGVIKAGIGLATGEGAGALMHAIPGYDVYHDIKGSQPSAMTEHTAPALTIHAPITIHASGADAGQVHEIVKAHIEDTIRQAHHDVRRGG
jgi:hypothetical protein